jgi:hypothetical protein
MSVDVKLGQMFKAGIPRVLFQAHIFGGGAGGYATPDSLGPVGGRAAFPDQRGGARCVCSSDGRA